MCLSSTLSSLISNVSQLYISIGSSRIFKKQKFIDFVVVLGIFVHFEIMRGMLHHLYNEIDSSSHLFKGLLFMPAIYLPDDLNSTVFTFIINSTACLF